MTIERGDAYFEDALVVIFAAVLSLLSLGGREFDSGLIRSSGSIDGLSH